MDGLKSLLRSRKVLLAVLGVVNTLVSHYLEIPADVWVSIDALLVVLIASIAYEDGNEKAGYTTAVRERLQHYVTKADPQP
jgi:hypothetical protein